MIEQILHFLTAHRLILEIFGFGLAIYALVQFLAWYFDGPEDPTGNGITIGHAKAFDNRSLALRIERLSASLAALKVVNQNVTENLSTIQKQSSTESSRSLTLEVKSTPAKTEGNGSSKKERQDAPTDTTTTADTAKSDPKPTVALAASDILNDQLNLASQIMNLETLYERSLSDRLIGEHTRLQTVLGFQVSITPPVGCENSVAVVEVAVRMKDNSEAVSLVALIPQEKTYNAQSVSTSAQSIGGSAVASVLTLGFSSKGESRQLFIHRDSDTIAVERDPRRAPTLFPDDPSATVFGWEFRPVLGRKAVSAGTRQMLAVVALPAAEDLKPNDVILQIKTRSYWRRYIREKQTSRGKWRLLPWKVDASRTTNFAQQELAVPNTAKIQDALEPKVTDCKWVNSGPESATIIVEGSNFFSGTKVVIGGTVHSEGGSLTLKSDQAIEVETTIASLATGDAVLSGRFGSSFQLVVPADRRPVTSLYITRADIRPNPYSQSYRISVDVMGLDAQGHYVDFTIADLQKLPEPILFIGAEPVPLPYDYFDDEQDSATGPDGDAEAPQDADPDEDIQSAESKAGVKTNGAVDAGAHQSSKGYVRVEAWIPTKTLTRNPSVAFRVPFCGAEYQASQPLNFAELNVTRMGSDAQTTKFRIASPLGFAGGVSVDLDKTYKEGGPELTKTSPVDLRFEIPTKLVSQYQNMVVRIGAEPYLSPVPVEDKPKPKTTIETTGKPPHIKKGSPGPIEWSGTALDGIIAATLVTNTGAFSALSQPGAAAPVRSPAGFSIYDGGKRIDVYFIEESTEVIGKAEVEFLIAGGGTLRAPLFISNETS